ncbi:unnamed protein product [Cuscuta campestris]|uniref:Uncharacterized protein n=1 Tax=Cuscuta campestris TaxID=132261 RepID=A0A484N9W0_9ASTE|nr:unnamed protein product [Cuscuta campestris]
MPTGDAQGVLGSYMYQTNLKEDFVKSKDNQFERPEHHSTNYTVDKRMKEVEYCDRDGDELSKKMKTIKIEKS